MYIKELLPFFLTLFCMALYFLVSKTWLKENEIHQQIWNQRKLIKIAVRELQMTSYTTVSPTCLLPCWIVCKGINHVHLANHHKLTHKFHTVISDLKKERKEIAINVKVFPLSCVLFSVQVNHYFLGLENKKSSWLALKTVTVKCLSNLSLCDISVCIRHHRIHINKTEGFFCIVYRQCVWPVCFE